MELSEVLLGVLFSHDMQGVIMSELRIYFAPIMVDIRETVKLAKEKHAGWRTSPICINQHIVPDKIEGKKVLMN